MSPKQGSYFFAVLWPKACSVQGWKGDVKQTEPQRRTLTLQATTKLHAEVKGMRAPTNRMSLCDQDQLSAVFALVKHLGKPLDLKAARRAENPAEVVTEDARKRLIFKIRESMERGDYNDAYVQKIAAWNCRVDQVSDWTTLTLEQLRTVLIHLTDRANEKDPDVNQRGPNRGKAATEDTTVYQMRPSRKFVPKTSPVLVTVSESRHGDDDNIPY